MSFADMFKPPPEPLTPLGRLRLLGPHAAVRMSPLQFGGISLGSGWADYTNSSKTKEESFALLDAFVEAGGVSIDTANNYSNEESEKIIGEWMKERGNRDRLVIATKWTECFQASTIGKNEAALTTGNSKKSLHVSLRESLKKLQTDYIDILYMHWYDHTVSVEELMDALDIVVKQGKVLYLGISDCPAWFVAACNTYAKATHKTPFVVLQTKWNVMSRDIERDLLPMARAFGLAIAPFGVMAEGRLLSKKQLAELKASGNFRKGLGGDNQTEEEVRYSEVLAEIGAKHGVDSVPPVALAYLFSKYPHVFPIVGVQNKQQIHDNAKAMEIHLTVDEIKQIEAVKPLDYGFPTSMVGRDPHVTGRPGGNPATHMGTIDYLVDRRVYSSQLADSEKFV